MQRNRVRTFVVGVLAAAGVFFAASAFASNPSTFSTTATWNSGSGGATNGQCFVSYNWNSWWGATTITVTNNGNQMWSPSGMAYSISNQIQCTDGLIHNVNFSTSTQSRTQFCPWPYSPTAYAGIIWSLTDNGCVF